MAAAVSPEEARPPEGERSLKNRNNNNPRGVKRDLNENLDVGTRPATTIPVCSDLLGVDNRNELLLQYLGVAARERAANKNRNSLHQDVEEALNSLLWQPYEYQNNSSSSSSFSSCCSLASLELEKASAQADRCGNTADPDLGEEMVNNPRHREKWLNQSRERASGSEAGCCTELSVLERAPEAGVVSRSDSARKRTHFCDDMRVEITNSSPAVTDTGQEPVNNLVLNVGHPVQNAAKAAAYQRSLSTDMIPSNLVSANVVGLPNHPRHGSVPVSTPRTPQNGFIFANHPRNCSEPAPTSVQERNIACANIVSILNHHRHSSGVGDGPTTPQKSDSNTTTLNVSKPLPSESRAKFPVNVSNVDVSFYRAIPVTVVSSVPTIQCVNSCPSNSHPNHISNVNIVQAMPLSSTSIPVQGPPNLVVQTEVVQIHAPPAQFQESAPASNPEPRARTYTSTEAQTDDICTVNVVRSSERALNREQRRRERRERRHQKRLNVANHQHQNLTQNERLPDILNSHLPPPYSPLTAGVAANVNVTVPQGPLVPNNVVPGAVIGGHHLVAFPPPPVMAGQVPLVQGAPLPVSTPSGFRFPFPAAAFRRSRFSEESPKGCCGLLAWRPGSLRWFIALIALVAVCCVLIGTALGAMRPAGRDHLTVSLLMIGVGIVLVTVSGVAWRLTSHDSSTCRTMLGLGSTESIDVCPRRFVPRLPPSYGRPHHPYAAMMYPEFQYRPPPPSYQASMQEYRLRLLLLDRGSTPQIQPGAQNGVSPPPTYRSHVGSLLRAPLSSRRDATQSEYSFPPSYRSQTSSSRPQTIELQANAIIHHREQSLSFSESNHGGSVITGVNILNGAEDDIALDNITIDSLKMVPESDINPVKMLLKGSRSDLEGTKDGNLVTIVQTSDQNPVIVTVSGCSHAETGTTVQLTEIPSEMEILAHL